jgi:hypothetical protein
MKTCFKCKSTLDLSEFYKHPRMKDGHLNKCKACTIKDSENRRQIKEKDIEWFLLERKRHRIKSRKYRETKPIVASGSREHKQKWAQKNQHKKLAHRMVRNALRSGKMHRQPCCICGNKAHAHHDDYAKPLEIAWLCPSHHGERHAQINEKILRLCRDN